MVDLFSYPTSREDKLRRYSLRLRNEALHNPAQALICELQTTLC